MVKNTDYKISIEKRLTSLEVKVNDIMTNELPHLFAKVDRITWLLITSLASGVISLLVLLLK